MSRRKDPRGKRLRADGGAAALEFALLLPMLLVILGITMAVGRLWIVRSDVLAVARNASREAVLQPSGQLVQTDLSRGPCNLRDDHSVQGRWHRVGRAWPALEYELAGLT